MLGVSTRRAALLLGTALAVAGSAAASATTSNGVAVNGGGASATVATYQAIFGSDSLSFPTACPANGSTTNYSIFYGAPGSGPGATGFINNDSTKVGCGGSGLADDYGAGDLPIANNYTNGSSVFKTNYGYQLIQVPAYGLPITAAFNLSGKTTNGSLALKDADLCNIFSGAVQDWSQIAASGITTPTPIAVAYRQDSSGASFIFTSHLAAVCPKPTNGITFVGTTRFSSLFAGFSSFPCTNPANTCNQVPSGTFAVDASAQGTGAQQGSINAHANSIGYISPDYTKIANAPAGTNPPPVASVNGILPTNGVNPCCGTTDQVTTALSTQSTSGTNATNPDSFGFVFSNPSKGYPIVGYTYLYLSSCYANKTKVTVLSTWLNSLYNSNGAYGGVYTDIRNGDFAPVAGVKSNAKPGSSTFAGIIIADYLSKTAVVPLKYSTGSGAKCTNGR